MPARPELAGGQFLVADVEQKKRLHAVDLALVAAIKLVLDHVEQLTMQPLHEVERLEIDFAQYACAVERLRDLRFGQCRHFIFPSRFSQDPPIVKGKTNPHFLKGRKN